MDTKEIAISVGAVGLIPVILPGISPSPLLAQSGGSRSHDFRATSAGRLRFYMVYSPEGGIK
jgi:hypothetical protein